MVSTVNEIQLSSWRTYENYTGPLGLQTLTDITGNHYGVNVEASERNGWGQWHRADEQGVGMDRTVATGTGYIGQYRPAVAKVFESLETCPDDLAAVPASRAVHVQAAFRQDGDPVHLRFALRRRGERSPAMCEQWKSLRGSVDDQRYGEVLAQLEYQAGQAMVWRDAVTRWFARESGIADAKGRVGRYPGRVEAESMELAGYTTVDVAPWEAASGGKAVTCASGHLHGGFAVRRGGGVVHASRAVLRPRGGSGAVPRAGR